MADNSDLCCFQAATWHEKAANVGSADLSLDLRYTLYAGIFAHILPQWKQ